MPLDSKTIGKSPDLDHSEVRNYYDRQYYKNVRGETVPSHYRRLARRFKPWQGKRLLDVGCGSGTWHRWPLRTAQALALPVWPLSWQYQVYHLCVLRRQ